ncbi:MAG: phosphate signaling complex protein PhoU [Candidatus Omnitrophica bacterium]|nr:phosphate signaling complex protein PhoU [Candidatus Omnitrophota bacterium]
MLPQKMYELKTHLLSEAALVEDMLEKSLQGIYARDEVLLKKVMEEQEPKVNDDDRMIEKFCVELIAQFDPVARDLRLALMIIKMNKDLERTADHAVNVCQSGLFLVSNSFEDTNNEVRVMAEGAIAMFKDSIKAFALEDVVLANDVCNRDNSVDDAGDRILKRLTVLMQSKKSSIAQSLHIMRIAHNLERIADLSTNIAEEVIYIVQGEDIKHHHHSSS